MKGFQNHWDEKEPKTKTSTQNVFGEVYHPPNYYCLIKFN